MCVKFSITGRLRGSDERIRECSHSDTLALYVPLLRKASAGKANIEGEVENECGGSNRLVKKARMSGAPLPFITHHGRYLRVHLNEAVQENAKGARMLFWMFDRLCLG